MRYFLFLFLFPVVLFAQAPEFKGRPLAVEEIAYVVNEQGNRDPKPRYTQTFHFDDAGHVVEHWYGTPDDKQFMFHYTHTYKGDRHVKSVQRDEKGNVWETLEHFYDPDGKLVRYTRTGSTAWFNQNAEVKTDSLDRIVWIKTTWPKGGEQPQVTENSFTCDTLAVSTTRDVSGQVISTVIRRMNEQGDLLSLSQTDKKGEVAHEAQYSDYRYDEHGNWTERKGLTQYLFSGEKNTSRTHEVRRIIYPSEHPTILSPEYLHGVWASFLYGLQLEIYPDGTFLVYIDGSRKDGGQWQLDTEKNTLSFTGKEHREEYERVDYRYEDGVIIFYQPGREEEVRLWKIR